MQHADYIALPAGASDVNAINRSQHIASAKYTFVKCMMIALSWRLVFNSQSFAQQRAITRPEGVCGGSAHTHKVDLDEWQWSTTAAASGKIGELGQAHHSCSSGGSSGRSSSWW
jgi:hypothetical protein